MKIKDVMEKTQLTDRAIRLYMENGLVSPSCNESYAGRKNIEFSEEDIEALRNVATLRKAGFSISEIKTLKQGSVPCRKTVEEFIEKTSVKIESDKAVVEKLEAVVTNENLTIETICESLNAVTEEKAVPTEDSKISPAEKIERIFFFSLGVTGAVYTLLSAIFQYLNNTYNYPMRFPTPTKYFIFKVICIIMVLGISIYYLVRYRKNNKRPVIKKERILSIAALVILVPTFLCSLWMHLGSTLSSFEFYSQTTNLNKYQIIDDDVEFLSDDINKFFPIWIESYAKDYYDVFGEPAIILDLINYHTYPHDMKYFYRYQLVHDDDTDFTMLLQQKLSNDEFIETVQKYENFENEVNTIIRTRQKGDWVCLYYNTFGETPEDYYGGYFYRIFAYNSKTNTVRYIMEYNAGSPTGLYTVPYHMDLTW